MESRGLRRHPRAGHDLETARPEAALKAPTAHGAEERLCASGLGTGGLVAGAGADMLIMVTIDQRSPLSGAEIGPRPGMSREAVRLSRARPDLPPPLGPVARSVAWDSGRVSDWAISTHRHPVESSAAADRGEQAS
jgi:hypothetical protein